MVTDNRKIDVYITINSRFTFLFLHLLEIRFRIPERIRNTSLKFIYQYMTIIITGTSSGIGFVLAEYFGKKGHNVYGLSRKHTESRYFRSIPTDITDNNAVQNAVAEVLKTESGLIS